MTSSFPRLLMSLTFALAAAGGVFLPISAAAQEGEVAVSEATPGTGEETPADPAPTGVLAVVAMECQASEAEGYLALLLESEFAPDASCVESAATVLVDGVDYGPASPGLELVLDAGWHSVTDVTTGASRDIEVYADSVSTMWVVSLTAVAVSEEEQVGSTITLSLVVHVCEPSVISADSLLAQGGRNERLGKCPVMTLPGEFAPDGSVSAGQDWFDFTIQDAGGFSASLADAVFVPDASCESELGVELNTNPFDDACYSISRYDLDVPATSLSVSPASIPALLRFGYAESGDPAMEGAVGVIDMASGATAVDAGSGYGDPLAVHMYLLSPPQLTIVQHLCGEDVGSAEALEALGGFVPRALACPAVTRAVDGGGLDFDAVVADGAGVSHALAGAALETSSVCEFELGFDFNGDPNDNACLEMPAYRLEGVTRGAVEIWQTFGSPDHAFGGLDFVPGSDDGATFLGSDPASAMVSLDSSGDGDVTVHLYAIPASNAPAATVTPIPTVAAPPTATPTPVDPSVSTGSVQIAALYCIGSRTATTLTALPPGQTATAAEMGGNCFGGDGQVQITLASGEVQPSFRLGRQGMQWVDGLPASGGADGPHLLTDRVSNQLVPFDIQPGVVTRVILRIEVALGSGSGAGSGPTTTGGGESTQTPDPLDFLNGLVTDVLVTDELSGIPHAGTSYEGSYDSNSFVVDLLGGLETDELASVTAEGIPVVGVRNDRNNGLPWPLVMAVAGALAMAMASWWSRRRSVSG